MAEGGGIIVPFRCLLNYLLLVCVVSVHSGVTTVSPIVCYVSMHQCIGMHLLCVYTSSMRITELFRNIRCRIGYYIYNI